MYKTPAPAARRYYREGSGEGEDGEGEVEGEGDSMDSIQLAPDLRASIGGMLHGAEVGLDVLDEDEEEEEASDGEVEYMPPKVSSESAAATCFIVIRVQDTADVYRCMAVECRPAALYAQGPPGR